MSQQEGSCGCKLGRVTAEYGFSDIDSRLTEDGQNGTGVRRLTVELNKDLIKPGLADANVSRVEWSRTPVYKALHTDELNQAEEIEIRRELDRAGVDVEQLSSNLVSHQTVYRHLTRCLDASKEDDPTLEERREKARNTAYALQQRTETVTEPILETLQSTGVSDLGEVEVFVNLQVVCDACGKSMDFETAINDGCDCKST